MTGDHSVSIVGEDSVLSAQVVAKDLVVLGRFEGSVDVRAVFRIGKGGYARAQVRSKQVEIEGTFEGEVSTGLLVLRGSARAQGLFQVERLRMDDGAILNGTVKPPGTQKGSPEEPASGELLAHEGEDDLERWEGEGGTSRLVD